MDVALPASHRYPYKQKDIGFAWDLTPFNTNAYIIVDIYEEVHVNKKGS